VRWGVAAFRAPSTAFPAPRNIFRCADVEQSEPSLVAFRRQGSRGPALRAIASLGRGSRFGQLRPAKRALVGLASQLTRAVPMGLDQARTPDGRLDTSNKPHCQHLTGLSRLPTSCCVAPCRRPPSPDVRAKVNSAFKRIGTDTNLVKGPAAAATKNRAQDACVSTCQNPGIAGRNCRIGRKHTFPRESGAELNAPGAVRSMLHALDSGKSWARPAASIIRHTESRNSDAWRSEREIESVARAILGEVPLSI
jgi:hypothetical protein